MPSIQNQHYNGCTIVAMATPAGNGQYHSIFSVISTELSDRTDQSPLAHQETITESPCFATEAEAIDAARERAQAWVDMQAN
jgi:hypothetical protein